jgi:glycosyltransferase involved in cell wall biosynthesis
VEISRNFRLEFNTAILETVNAATVALNIPVPPNIDKGSSIRSFLAKSKLLRALYRGSKTFLKQERNTEIETELVLKNSDSFPFLEKSDPNKLCIYLVVPFFMEMNGPDSHYGSLIDICKSTGLNVYYVATEENYIKSYSASSFSDFRDISFVAPQNLNTLFSGKSIIINCGSPWIYRNIQELVGSGATVIDYLFNHVGHTASNIESRKFLFHTVCQHHKLLAVLQETCSNPEQYSCIPIPFPTQYKNDVRLLSREDSPLWVGRLSSEKGIDRLTSISKELCSRTGRQIRVIGGGKAIKDLKGEILSGTVNYLGELPHKETLEMIGNTRILLNTSYVEGVSIVAMEALALGADVISFDIGGMSELNWHPKFHLVKNGLNNEEFIDKIVNLMSDASPAQDIEIPKDFGIAAYNDSWKALINLALSYSI